MSYEARLTSTTDARPFIESKNDTSIRTKNQYDADER